MRTQRSGEVSLGRREGQPVSGGGRKESYRDKVAVELRLTGYCLSIILQLKKKRRKKHYVRSAVCAWGRMEAFWVSLRQWEEGIDP